RTAGRRRGAARRQHREDRTGVSERHPVHALPAHGEAARVRLGAARSAGLRPCGPGGAPWAGDARPGPGGPGGPHTPPGRARTPPLGIAPEWDRDFTLGVGVSALLHAAVAALVVFLIMLAPAPLPPMQSYTVELTDPTALGGRLAFGPLDRPLGRPARIAPARGGATPAPPPTGGPAPAAPPGPPQPAEIGPAPPPPPPPPPH